MMGEHSDNQDRLFYSFTLDEHVPADHLLRGIDRFLDLADLRQHLAPFYSHTGRPSVDPELMVRMLLLGYCFGIRSERRLCEEVHLNLAYRWFCRPVLEDKVPDHSSFSKNRHGRFRESDVFRHVFEGVLRRCMDNGELANSPERIPTNILADRLKRLEGAGCEFDHAPEVAAPASVVSGRGNAAAISRSQTRSCCTFGMVTYNSGHTK